MLSNNLTDSQESKVYFCAGDIVTLRLEIPNKPKMLVIKKETSMFKHKEDNILKGIRCIWFTTDGTLQEYVYNTKDLLKIK